jgi:hypothetical protein
MSEGKTIGYTIVYVLIVLGVVVSCILTGFGILSIIASTDPTQPAGWQGMGIIFVVIGLAILALAVGVFVFLRIRRAREKQLESPQEIVQKIDFSGDVELATMKCKSCGGELSKKDITVEAGAVFVSCPYCNASYQVVEEPKW